MTRAVLLTTLMISAALAATASAATQIGQTVSPTASCSGNYADFQGASLNNQFVVPYDGVITSWSFLGQLLTVPSQMKLELARVHASTLDVVAKSDVQFPVANQLKTFSSRVPAQTGEVIGFYFPSPSFVACATAPAPGYTMVFVSGDVAPGTNNLAFTSTPSVHLDLSARLEPDADHDGYGDETQDQCPTDASTQGPCRVPVTGQRAAALKKCKKKHSARARRRCRKKAKLLPI